MAWFTSFIMDCQNVGSKQEVFQIHLQRAIGYEKERKREESIISIVIFFMITLNTRQTNVVSDLFHLTLETTEE